MIKIFKYYITVPPSGVRGLFVVYLLFQFTNSYTQDLGAIGKDKKPFKINGSASANQTYYRAFGIENRRNPYNYYLSANLTFGLYGWTVPVSVMYSNQQTQFQQPFNRYGMQPYYKWVKLYIGYNSMSFSPYTMNGHIFLGGGIQLTPGIFRLSAMYGRLNQAIEEDTSNRAVIPYYERRGMGLKVGVGKGSDFIDLIGFYAKDDSNSIRRPIRQSIKPAENLVLSVMVSKKLFKKFIFTTEYANSLLTNNTAGLPRSENINATTVDPFGVIKQNNSTTLNSAYKANLTFVQPTYSLGVGFEHIDPEYRTLGAYYFNNDLENYTLNGSKKLLKGKLNISGNIGFQYNNLKNQKASQMRRTVGSVNIMFVPNQKWNFSGSYSNFQTNTRVRSQFERINAISPEDTLKLNSLDFVQLSQSAQVGVGHTLGNPSAKDIRSSIQANLMYQNVSNAGSSERVSTGTQVYSSNLSFNRNLMLRNMSYMISFNSNLNELGSNRSLLIGPSISINKSLFNKTLRITSSLAYTTTFINGRQNGDIYTLRSGGNFTVKKKHIFNVNLTGTQRFINQEVSPNGRNYFEFTVNSGYTYSF